MTSDGNFANLSLSTGVKVSVIRPFCTSLPVVTIPTFFFLYGKMEKIGSVPATSAARSIFSFSITRGIILVPASLSPFFTGKSPWRDAIIISPSELTASRASLRILSTPSMSAISSIFPSFISEPCMVSESPAQIL